MTFLLYFSLLFCYDSMSTYDITSYIVTSSDSYMAAICCLVTVVTVESYEPGNMLYLCHWTCIHTHASCWMMPYWLLVNNISRNNQMYLVILALFCYTVYMYRGIYKKFLLSSAQVWTYWMVSGFSWDFLCCCCLNYDMSVVSLYICGQSSWKPWLIACGIDISRFVLFICVS